MVSLFNVLGLLFWIFGLGSCTLAKGAIQETGGLLMFLIGTVLVVGAAVLDQLRKLVGKNKTES
ncbi:MAG: hypothetical protein KJ787_14045 [Gammaproteobacteria bacterium]|nr:hypothetical protein [Gammaproteobacteria bacterium]MBU1647449.1 hypothetical protein [Gammaproteobacteria bacterium]MBU1973241.1 hypothetical protein [Gammaproteobacteria bacterium]